MSDVTRRAPAPVYSYYPPDVLPSGFRIVRGDNDVLVTESGDSYIDLLCGSGTVFLGHANPAIARALKQQLDGLWNTGVLPTAVGDEAREAIQGFFPESHHVAVVYSTGMEAIEFAIRVARQATGRKGVIGFRGGMHGKSMAAARLGWPNELVTLPDFHTLPYLPEQSEPAILDAVRAAVATRTIASVFLEPLLGSSGGHLPSGSFVRELAQVCREHGTLLVMDEIFTGFYRTGSPFLHHDWGVLPDIVLVGKAIGNGFPVSAVVVDRRHAIQSQMLPGSTFAGNPLAAAVVLATLGEMRAMDLTERVGRIERTILDALGDLQETGIALRGKGALWILEIPRSGNVRGVLARVIAGGVMVSQTANFIRLLPPATIGIARLEQACAVIHRACRAPAGVPA